MTTFTVTPDPVTGSHRLSIKARTAITRVQRTDTNGSYDVRTLTGQLPHTLPLGEVRRNHCMNPSMETNSTHWATNAGTGGGVTPSRPTTGGMFGTAFYRATWTVPSTVSGYVEYSGHARTANTFEGGAVYTISGWIRSSVAQSFRARASWEGAGPGYAGLGLVVGDLTAVPADTWTRVHLTATAPAGATGAWINWDASTGQASLQTIDVDGVLVEKAATLGAYFDGSTAADNDGTYTWSGTAHGSASVQTGAIAALVLDDYEPAQGTSTYTVTSTLDTVTAQASLVLGTPWLGVPVTPQFSARIQTLTGYEAGIAARSTILDPEGSPFPVIITRSASSRRGTLDLYGGDYPAALALLRLLGRGQVVFLRQAEHAGMDMFFSPLSADIRTLTTAGAASVFGVNVSYVEVARPGAPLSGALGWTWQELKNTYATWGDVFNTYATWGDVRTNKP